MNNKFDLIAEYQRLSKIYNLSDSQVKDIYESQFHFTRLAMKEGIHDDPNSFKNINYIYLGKLYVKKGVVNKMKERKLKKKMKDEKLLEGFVIDPEKYYHFIDGDKITIYDVDPSWRDRTDENFNENINNYSRLGKYLDKQEIDLLKDQYIKDNENNT